MKCLPHKQNHQIKKLFLKQFKNLKKHLSISVRNDLGKNYSNPAQKVRIRRVIRIRKTKLYLSWQPGIPGVETGEQDQLLKCWRYLLICIFSITAGKNVVFAGLFLVMDNILEFREVDSRMKY